jgi:hypothetical protein
MNQATGKYIILIGVTIIIVGVVIYFFHNYFKWFGKLPGDIRIEKENFKFYFPVVTMIIVSLVATILINIARKIF